MKSISKGLFGRDSRWIDGRLNRVCLTLLVAVFAVGLGGCGGGGGNGGASEPAIQSPDKMPAGRGTVMVTVTDAFGAPVAGADVLIYSSWGGGDRRVVADANGHAEVSDMIATLTSVTAYGPDSYGFTPSQTLSPNGVLKFDVRVLPAAESTGGITQAAVPAGGVSADGRSLEFSLQIMQVPDPRLGEYWAWGTDAVRVMACTPDPGNDLPTFSPDCVSGPDGFDATYAGLANGAAISVKRVEAPGSYSVATAYTAALLLDQSAHVIVNDSADARLFAAKYFLTYANQGAPKLLAAFASDDTASGQLSLLPQKPVTIFPVDGPQYTDDGRTLYSTVDSLATLEGGAAPLFTAVDRMLDFVAANKTRATNALVVVTDGHDDHCGSRAACQAVRDALIRKSAATGVAIVTVGLASATGDADHETLGLLAQGARHGGAFWAENPNQLPSILGNVHLDLSDLKDSLQATFRIESPVAGAFSSGRTVMGQVRLEVCPWDCIHTFIPFVVRIP
jgi:hypothetical protein